jgi:hypothetical protein
MLNDKSTLPTSSSTQQLPQPDLQRLFAWTLSSTRPLTFRDVVSPYRWHPQANTLALILLAARPRSR